MAKIYSQHEKKSEVVNVWATRRDIPLAILGWIVLLIIILRGLSYISGTIILLLIAGFLAYALVPAVTFLEKYMPRFLAIFFTYLVILSGLGVLIYFIASTAVLQFELFAHNVQSLLTPRNGLGTPLFMTLKRFGISQQQISLVGQDLTASAEQLTSSIVPFLSSIFTFVLDILVVAVLSIYLLTDGIKITEWLRNNTPPAQEKRMEFLMRLIEKIVGGYIRGQVTLAFIVGFLVGIGMVILQVPYAVLLGVLAFLLEFIPILGTLISGAICVVLALSQGWIIAVIVLVYFIIVHVIEGDILGPRIVGKAIGLHPLVSLIALIAGSELFGLIGALFASPVAGIVQALLITVWTEWKSTHTELFAKQKRKVVQSINKNLSDDPLQSKKNT